MMARLTTTIFAAALALPMQAATVTVVPNLYNGKLPVISELMPDGKSIMGVAGDEVFRWTPGGGRVVLGSLGPRVLATAISADGTTVVGRRVSFSDQEAIRWTAGEGLTVLPRSAEFPHNPFPTHVLRRWQHCIWHRAGSVHYPYLGFMVLGGDFKSRL